MKLRPALLTISMAAFCSIAFAQLNVSTNKVVYQRKGADVPEWKQEFEVNYPVFSGAIDPGIKGRLEQTFSYWRVFKTSLAEETSDQWLYSLDYKVNYNKNGILEMELFRSGVGAYPSVYTSTIVADLDTGNRIRIPDVFENRIGLLTMIDEAQSIEMAVALTKADEKEAEFLREKFKESRKASDAAEEFSVSERGVTFIFDYDFAHAEKASEPAGRYLLIWDRLKPFVKRGGKFDVFVSVPAVEANTVPLVELRIGGLLGGVRDGKLVDAMTSLKDFESSPSFALFGPANRGVEQPVSKYNTNWKIKLAAEQSDDVCPDFRYVESVPDAKIGVGIGSRADWNPIPHDVVEIDKKNPVYEAAVATFLRTKGITNPVVKIEQIYKVDLEGDGTDEIVIRATNYHFRDDGFTADKGGYSFVMVRKIVNGAARDLLLTGDFIGEDFPGAENKHEISAILDLNGDGKMEVIVFGEYYEGAWVSVYGIENDKAIVLLETGCGL